MSKFTAGVAITTTTASVSVDAGLAVGRHLFRLVVQDDSGNTSKPSEVVVEIRQKTTTTTVRPTVATATVVEPTVATTTVKPTTVRPTTVKPVG